MPADDWENKRDELLTNCERSVRYHASRLHWFEAWHRIFLFLIITIGALIGFFGDRFDQSWAFVAMTIAVADLVFNLDGSARAHLLLRRRFYSLLGRMQASSDGGEDKLNEWTREIHEICADEPPVYRVLHVHCQNQVCEVLGQRAYKQELNPLYYLLMHLWRFDGFDFPSKHKN